MKKIICIILLLFLTTPAFGLDECSLLGDHAVMFAQWKSSGKALSETIRWIDESYKGMSLYNLYISLAEDIYNSKKELSPRAWRILVEDQCKEAKGDR